MGRASNRKKAQRQAGVQAEVKQVKLLLRGLQVLVQEGKDRAERAAAARRAWCGSAESVPAEPPPWPENSLGDRLLTGSFLGEAQDAPTLLAAGIPDAAAIVADPAHWNVATSALVRAVIFDGLTPDHPEVSALCEVLAPVVETELAYRQADGACPDCGRAYCDVYEPEDFPELDGPVFLLGGRALMDATWAVVGEDPLSDVLGVLRPALDAAVPGLGGQVVADALIGAFSTEYSCDQPGDDEVLTRIRSYTGNGLETLAAGGTMPPGDLLRIGLSVLSALARLCQSGSRSVLQRS
jgi:hypothetical protein